MIHVALCFSDTSGVYYKYPLVTALSIFDNTQSAVSLHILHDETLTDEARRSFVRLSEKYGQTVVFHAVDASKYYFEKADKNRIGRGALFRLTLKDMLDVAKVLYFDCDVVCTCDISYIYNVDIEQRYIGVVRECPRDESEQLSRIGLNSQFYFNSGMLLFNLAALRKELPDFAERLFAIHKEWEAVRLDQDALNIFFSSRADKVLFLPEECNFMIGQTGRGMLPLSACRGKVLHFTARKPWKIATLPALFFWNYYARLFPQEDIFARILALDDHKDADLCLYVMAHHRLRKWIKRFREVEVHGLVPTLLKRLRPRGK